jgi:nicotinamide-nucleotide amidase
MVYNEAIVNSIKEIIARQQQTIAVAESVTSGHLQAALSLAIEASNIYQGGITCYNLGQKTKHLHVDPILAEQTNSVHQRVADQMAIGVSKSFISNYGIGITGYASIVPECEKEGLFAFFSLAYKQETVLQKRLTSAKEKPYEVQLDYTEQVLQNILDYLQQF